MTDDPDHDTYDPDDELGEPTGSCDECGVNLYEDDDDGSGLCDQCGWRAAQA